MLPASSGSKLPRIVTRAPVVDATIESRKLEPKVAAALIQVRHAAVCVPCNSIPLVLYV